MEEVKIIDLAQPQKPETFHETAIWQWQSGPNPDPWAEKDPTKRTWQDYSDNDCLIIEEAFSLNKEIAELKDYEIDLKKMVQVNKQYKNRIRRVRRQEKSRFMMEMSEPVAVVRDQKTMNQAFGTIQQFLDYIMKRTPKAYGLYQKLRNLTLDCQETQFQDIIQEVLECIEKGAETREKIIKTRTGSQTKNFINEAKRIVSQIQNNSATLGDFLKTILRVYTMETFICYWLNELLRSEDWEEINVLTPYLVCLVYTFKLPDYIIKYQEPVRAERGWLNNLFGLVPSQKICLYRGAALTKEHFKLYDTSRIKYFSWNGVTSTSRDQNVALKFIKVSLEKAKKIKEPKVGVLFKIETEFASSEDCEGMIDVFQNSCSQYPDEQEVILAPGTVFKLLESHLAENFIFQINLKVSKKFEKTKENKAFLGTLQNEYILKERAMIDGLPSQQSFAVLELLKGNKLIRKLEIRNSEIEEHILKEIEQVRVTTNIRKQDIKLINNTIAVSSIELLAYYFSAEKLDSIFRSNKIRFKEEDAKNKDRKITSLTLSGKTLGKFQQNNQLEEFSENIKRLSQIENMDFSNPGWDILNDEFIYFLQCIKELKFLQTLSLKFSKSVSKEGLEFLCQTIGSLDSLEKLSLEMTLSGEALFSLKKVFGSIVSVKNLSLDFKFSGVSNEGLNHLKDGLGSLTSVQNLSLEFESCSADEKQNYFKILLRQLTSLRYLSLSLKNWKNISDKVLNSMKTGLKSLTFLQHLSLKFWQCSNISNEGLKHLKDALITLTSLQELDLDFYYSDRISDEGLNHIKSTLIVFPSLQHLSLEFWQCYEISNEGLKHLKDALITFISLQKLKLCFSECHKISNEGLNDLKSGLVSLTSLQHLSLCFDQFRSFSDEGLNHLKDGLIPLIQLQHLSLDFSGCDKISDVGLYHLRDGLMPFTSIQHLDLKFSRCRKISDKGLNHLKSGLIPLISLQYLSLSFEDCQISDEGLNHLKDGVMPLTSLQHLSLKFACCEKISDKGLNHLASGLISLTFLQHLSLKFFECRKISKLGLNYLNNLISLLSLQSLELNFIRCDMISDKQFKQFQDQLKFIEDLSCDH